MSEQTRVKKGEGAEVEVKNQPPVGTIRVINTDLLGKEDAFRILALAEAVVLPILFIGDRGTAKTKVVMDYGRAYHPDAKEFDGTKVFMIEVDEGTMESAIKGTPDLQKLYEEKRFQLASPVTEAEIIIINEVDKARSGFRNCMLSIMNERKLFQGAEKKHCPWKLYVATCNEIPKEEQGNPFWDRFILKFESSRLSAGQMMEYYRKGDKDLRATFQVTIPTREEYRAIKLDDKILEAFVKHGHKVCSDRTLSYVPDLIKAATIVYNTTAKQAVIKIAELLINREAAVALSKDLYSEAMKQAMNRVEKLKGITDFDLFDKEVQNITGELNRLMKDNKITVEEVQEIGKNMVQIAKQNKISDDISFELGES